MLVDIAGSRPARACRRVLTRDGTHVLIGGPTGRWLQPVGHMVPALAELIGGGKVTPVIDRRFSFEELPAAVRYQEAGHAPGKVVVTV